MNFRFYQTTSLDLILYEFARGINKVVLCLPTGAGKTVIFMEAARRAAIKGKRVLLLTHRIELQSQARKTGGSTGIDVIMVETYWNLLKATPDAASEILHTYDLVIIDEAHIGNFRKIVDLIAPMQFLIGATATPISKPPMKEQYGSIVCPISIPELVELGYLATPKTFQSELIHDVEFDEIPTVQGEFKTATLDELFGSKRVMDGMISDFINRGAYKKKSIIFCTSIKTVLQLEGELRNALQHAEFGHCTRIIVVHSKMKKAARDNAIDMFMHIPHYVVIINCGILTTGFDCPDIQVVIVNRATLSLALWFQMCGRGSRVTDTKQSFQIWDYGSNVKRLGHWEQKINWTQIFEDPTRGRNKVGMRPTKECPKCSAFLAASIRKCKYCGYIYPATAIEILRGELNEVAYSDVAALNGRDLFGLSLIELAEYVKYKRYNSKYFEVVLFHSGRREELESYWKNSGYKWGYIRMRKDLLKNMSGIKNKIIEI